MLDERMGFVGHARDHMNFFGADAAPDGLHLLFPASEGAVRKALSTVHAALRGMGVQDEARGLAELVLAEVLNNVVEHAYADRGHGIVEMEIWRTEAGLSVRIQDDGVPMPGGTAPQGKTHDLDVPIDDLPEGGFGWSIIHDLTHNLSYHRDGARNRLSFDLHTDEISSFAL